MLKGPKKIKFKKVRKGKLLKFNYKSNNLTFGTVGLKAKNSGILNARQIEAARKAIVRKNKKKIKVWIKVFPNVPVSAKSTGVRMGKGKGQFSHWIAKIKGGTLIFEISGANVKALAKALKSGANKLPFKTLIFN